MSETVFLGIIRKLRDCRERWTVAITVEGGKCVKVMLDVNNGREYLQYVIECLNRRLKETDTAILEGTRENREHARILLGKLYRDGSVRV